MPRKTIVPKYLLHKRSGQAYTYHRLIDTPDHRKYLGPYGSEQSQLAYNNICRQVAEIQRAGHKELPKPPALGPAATLFEVGVAYREYAKAFYRRGEKMSSEYAAMMGALNILFRDGGFSIAAEYRPKNMRRLQQSMAEEGYARSFINHTCSRIKRFFKWSCLEELLDEAVYGRLRCVDGLRPGDYGVKEAPPIRPAQLNIVYALLPYVPPVIADMMQVQYLCATRPDEVCRMRACDIDRSGDIWIYNPVKHKNGWRGKTLYKAIPPTAQAIIAPRLLRDPVGYLFPPSESWQWSLENRKAVNISKPRKTKVYPSELKRREKLKEIRRNLPKKKEKGPHYSSGSYCRAVSYGFQRAVHNGIELERFTPIQLRHAIVTYLSAKLGQQKAQVYAGHENFETTSIYNEKTMNELKEVARQFESLLQRAS